MTKAISRIAIAAACIAAWMFAASCSSDTAKPRSITRLDKAMESYSHLDSDSRIALADSLAPEIAAFFKAMGYDQAQAPELLWWSTSDNVAIFQPDVDAKYPTLDNAEQSLGHILARAEREKLPIGATRFASVVWGRQIPIAIVDSVALIALNHYMGADYPGYTHFPAYRRAEKEPELLAYDLAGHLAANGREMSTKAEPTVINCMLYEGAITEAKMRLVKDAILSRALSLRPDQLEMLEDNLQQIKQEMAQQRMLYDTDPDLLNRLFAAAPNTQFLGGAAPGRTGRYVGYTLVRDYLKKHPDASLSFLLSPEFYDNPQTLLEIGWQ